MQARQGFWAQSACAERIRVGPQPSLGGEGPVDPVQRFLHAPAEQSERAVDGTLEFVHRDGFRDADDRAARAGGGHDNITVITARVQAGPA